MSSIQQQRHHVVQGFPTGGNSPKWRISGFWGRIDTNIIDLNLWNIDLSTDLVELLPLIVYLGRSVNTAPM